MPLFLYTIYIVTKIYHKTNIHYVYNSISFSRTKSSFYSMCNHYMLSHTYQQDWRHKEILTY